MSANDIHAQLEQEREIIQSATDGPWEADPLEGDLTGPEGGFVMEVLAWLDPDATFIAHARTALPLRNAQVQAVMALHKPRDPEDNQCAGCLEIDPGGYVLHPCPTVRAIEEAGK